MGNENTQLSNTGNLNGYLAQPQVVEYLGGKLGHDEAMKFKAALSSAVSTNPVLLNQCTPDSVISAALIGHSLNLPPSPQLGYYYIVPYNNRKLRCKEGQFQIGYKGYIQLAMRSGYYKKLNVEVIKEGEFESWNPLTEELKVNLISDPLERDKAKTVGYYGFFEYLNGFTKTMYWPFEKMQAHADKYAPAYKLADDILLKAGKIPQDQLWKFSSFWYKSFDDMGLKTILRQMLSKWGSMSVDMQVAYEQDIKTNYKSFGEAQTDSQNQIEGKQGSEEIPANFEPKDETLAEETTEIPDWMKTNR